jgi:hypothetical protein
MERYFYNHIELIYLNQKRYFDLNDDYKFSKNCGLSFRSKSIKSVSIERIIKVRETFHIYIYKILLL